MNQMAAEYEDALSASDYVAILRRRKWPLLITASVSALIAMAVAFLLPAKYTSEATILIEEQEVPREFVASTITSFAAQQIQVLSQRVLTAETIARVSDKYGLFQDGDDSKRPPITRIASEFRDLMSLRLVSADVIDPRSGRAQEATIAFTLAFTDVAPRTAQQVTNELVTMFLDENLRTRTARVANTEEFLEDQAAKLNQELNAMEGEIAEFKRLHSDALPELYQFNLSSLDRRSNELDEIGRRIRELGRSRIDLSSELKLLSPEGDSMGVDGSLIPNKAEMLRSLQQEYDRKLMIYHERHPDMLSLQRRIEELETGTSSAPLNQVPSNPAYVLLRTQLDAVNAEFESVVEKRASLADKVQALESLISKSPTVERDYSKMLRDYEAVQARYQDVRGKQRAAELAENMEQERKGERFVLVEPPSLPSEPSSPNRPAIASIGIALAVGLGVAMVLLLEALDGGVYTDRALRRLVGEPPFAVVGYIETNSEFLRKRLLRKRFVLCVLAMGILLIVLFHFLIKPLDVLWFSLISSFGA